MDASTPKVLIVDDENHVIAYLSALLQDNGYTTVSAGDGVEGLQVARSERPDLVALDISMPKKSGVRMYRDMREDPELRHIPVVIVTAVTGYAGDPEVFHKFLDSQKQVRPPEAFVPKPIDQQVFLNTVSSILRPTRAAQ